MSPKKIGEIESWETMLNNAVFLKNREETAECMDALHRRGCHQGEAMEKGKEFLRKTKMNQN